VWDLLLPHVEFAYNKAPSRTAGISPFKVVYGINPLGPLGLLPRPLNKRPSDDVEQRVKEMKKLHERVSDKIEKINSTYSAQANKHQREKYSNQVI